MPIGPARNAEPDRGSRPTSSCSASACLASRSRPHDRGVPGVAPGAAPVHRRGGRGHPRPPPPRGAPRPPGRVADGGRRHPLHARARPRLGRGAGAVGAARGRGRRHGAGHRRRHRREPPACGRHARAMGATWDVTARVAADDRELALLVDVDTDIEGLLAAKQDFVEDEFRLLHRSTRGPSAPATWSPWTGRRSPRWASIGAAASTCRVVEGRLPRTRNEVAMVATPWMCSASTSATACVPQGRTSMSWVQSVLPRFQTLGGADEAALNRARCSRWTASCRAAPTSIHART